MAYDVFLSYSYVNDARLAQQVGDGLARFAKPWWRRRALKIFRDQAVLSANPGVWSSIGQAIAESRYFVLLASPESAASPSVAREVTRWRSKHGSGGLLVLLTKGDIAWDDEIGDFDKRTTTAITPALLGCFSEAPRYVDLRWAAQRDRLDLTDGRFRDQIAEIAAPIRGMAKDDLAGADLALHRPRSARRSPPR